MSVLVTAAVLLAVALWALAAYNRLLRLRAAVKTAWADVDVRLRRRHDLVPVLIDTLRAALVDASAAFDEVVGAQQRAAAARGPLDAARKEDALTTSLSRLLTEAGQPGQSIDGRTVRELQDRLAAAGRELAGALTAYNSVAASYNTAIVVAPNSVIAGLAGFRRAELFELASPPGGAGPSTPRP